MSSPSERLTAVNVIVGRVVDVKPHPMGNRISIAIVEYGSDNQASVIFGGIREVIYIGCLVPFAPATKSCRVEGKKMRRRKFQGVYSYGELCSLYELGLVDTDTDQVAILEETSGIKVGQPLNMIVKDLRNMDELWQVFKEPIRLI